MESILREVCERVLDDPSISRDKAHLRAIGLQILGDAYMSVKKEDSNFPGDVKGFGDDTEYVKINKRSKDTE